MSSSIIDLEDDDDDDDDASYCSNGSGDLSDGQRYL